MNVSATFEARSAALVESAPFLDFCLRYAADRFSGGGLSRERLQFILSRPIFSCVCANECTRIGV